jgi:hypothetical protein
MGYMTKKYYKFSLKYEIGEINGIFLANGEDLYWLTTKRRFYIDKLGFAYKFKKDDFELFESDPDRVKMYQEKYGDTIIGVNPIDVIINNKEV